MKSSGYWALKYVLWMMIALGILLLIVLPLVTSLVVSYSPSLPPGFLKYIRIVESIQTQLLLATTAAWFFYVGSCIASFLNVVAWRVPRGQSILGSSHCPKCGTRLTFRDNVPIVGWLKNGGKCRYCQAPISKRYFNVEVILGTIFLAIVLLTLYSGGINLPLRTPDGSFGFERVLFDPKWDLIQIVVHQLLLISILFTFVLVRLENRPIPVSVFVVACLLGIGFTFSFPAVQIVPWQLPTESIAAYETFEWNQVWTLALGVSCGAGCGMLLNFSSCPGFETGSDAGFQRGDAIMGLSLCGLFLGWQSVISICLIVLLLDSFGTCCGRLLSRPTSILVATVIHLFCWKFFSVLGGYWPSHVSQPIQIVMLLLVLIVLAVVSRTSKIAASSNLKTK